MSTVQPAPTRYKREAHIFLGDLSNPEIRLDLLKKPANRPPDFPQTGKNKDDSPVLPHVCASKKVPLAVMTHGIVYPSALLATGFTVHLQAGFVPKPLPPPYLPKYPQSVTVGVLN